MLKCMKNSAASNRLHEYSCIQKHKHFGQISRLACSSSCMWVFKLWHQRDLWHARKVILYGAQSLWSHLGHLGLHSFGRQCSNRCLCGLRMFKVYKPITYGNVQNKLLLVLIIISMVWKVNVSHCYNVTHYLFLNPAKKLVIIYA